MSSISWSTSLQQQITSLRQPDRRLRVAVVGIGHELRGDDAVGVMIARALQAWAADQPQIVVIDGGSAPENQTGALRRFAPDLVLLIDAVDLDRPAGSIDWLAWETTTGLSASTHTLPPYLLGKYLKLTLGCEVALIGIQPAQLTLGSLSPAVKKAAEGVAARLRAILGENI